MAEQLHGSLETAYAQQEVLHYHHAAEVPSAIFEHGHEGHTCTAECIHSQQEADVFAATLFQELTERQKSHGETGHVCDASCAHTQQEADAFAARLFGGNEHSAASHGENGHICDAHCLHTQQEADAFAATLFTHEVSAAHHGEKGHVCDASCAHTQQEADAFASSLFEAPEPQQLNSVVAETSYITDVEHLLVREEALDQARQAAEIEPYQDEPQHVDAIQTVFMHREIADKLADEPMTATQTEVLSQLSAANSEITTTSEEIINRNFLTAFEEQTANEDTNGFVDTHQADGRLHDQDPSLPVVADEGTEYFWSNADDHSTLPEPVVLSEGESGLYPVNEGVEYVVPLAYDLNYETDEYQYSEEGYDPTEVDDKIVSSETIAHATETSENPVVAEVVASVMHVLKANQEKAPFDGGMVIENIDNIIALIAGLQSGEDLDEEKQKYLHELVRDLSNTSGIPSQELHRYLGLERDAVSSADLSLEILLGLKQALSKEYSHEFFGFQLHNDSDDASLKNPRTIGRLILSIVRSMQSVVVSEFRP